MKLQVPSSRFQVPCRDLKAASWSCGSIVNRKSQIVNGFTLVEMIVTLALLSLIVLALMAVFNSTQKAFRATLTQTDYLGSGRLVMEMIANDLAKMTPSYGTNDLYGKGFARYQSPYDFPGVIFSPVNYYMNLISYSSVDSGSHYLVQYLPGTSAQRTNVLENFFSLSRQNVNGSPTWVGTGYAVDPLSFPTNSLYRFYMTSAVMRNAPLLLVSNFVVAVTGREPNPFTNTVYWTHLMDGVVDLQVQAYDPNGLEITNSPEYYYNDTTNTYIIQNAYFLNLYHSAYPFLPTLKVYGCFMRSNTVPASVAVELGVLENATLQHAEGLPSAAAMNYLSNHVGQVHLFRQRVLIPGVDPTAYQMQ